ncbi:MAG: DUF2752 domain-containing protein [Bacteroidales bacterium]|nr:DUF2752 domain-containing protein [Bacteroidales bacterium]MDD3943376.1 DUF2752 domain-containing protein [Bacteroidales bacterium]MDD5314268.1 DUF2752 domain-containing protein [Bacteroidales bacterium]MDD5713602.1 DUF2752 domain-containing protein [Bacteroidales bacterium]NLN37503.1 DUF2752 domain-containing protein [Bacteroidales bacterium]
MKHGRKIAGITALFLFLLMPLLILLFDPGADHLQASQSFCPFKMLTGLPCPGCGMVKSMVSLYRGAWMESLEYHLFGPLMVLFSVCALVVMIIELIRGKEIPLRWLYSPGVAWGVAATLGTWHLARIIVFIFTHGPAEILKESIWA